MNKTQKRAIEILQNTPLFSGICERAFEKIMSRDSYSFHKLKSGESVIIKNALAAVISGVIKAHKTEGGKSVFLKEINEGEITGIATLFDKDSQYISTMTAKKDSEILIIKEETILQAIKNSSEFSEKFARLLCEKIRYLNGRIDAYTQPSVEEKLLEYIKHSSADVQSPFIEMSMLSLSSALGVGRASLYRALTNLEENGIISKEGKKIYLLREV